MGGERKIRVGMDSSDTPGTWRLVAECADEITTWTFINGRVSPDPEVFDFDANVDLQAMMVSDHVGRCGSCQMVR